MMAPGLVPDTHVGDPGENSGVPGFSLAQPWLLWVLGGARQGGKLVDARSLHFSACR